MALLDVFFKFTDPNPNLVDGQTRILISPLGGTLLDVAIPTDISAIHAMITPYAPVIVPSTHAPWVDLGGTDSAPQYARNLSLSEWKVQQRKTAILQVPNEVVRTFKIPIAEIARPDLLQMIENGPAATAVGSATGVSAQAVQSFGQFTDLLEYRLAAVSFMPLSAGKVIESGGGTRARMFAQVLYRCAIDAENVTIDRSEGEMVHADLTLRAYAESTLTQNAEYGAYFVEAAGTIT